MQRARGELTEKTKLLEGMEDGSESNYGSRSIQPEISILDSSEEQQKKSSLVFPNNSDEEVDHEYTEEERIKPKRRTCDGFTVAKYVFVSFTFDCARGFLFPAALAGLTKKYEDADEEDNLLIHSANHYDVGLVMNQSTDIAFNVMVGDAMGFALTRKPSDIPAHFRAVGNGNLGRGISIEVGSKLGSYLIVCAFHKGISHVSNELLDGDWLADDSLFFNFLQAAIENPFLTAFTQGVIGFALFKTCCKLFTLCINRLEEDKHFAPKTPPRWLVQKCMEGMGVIMFGEAVSTFLHNYGYSQFVNNTLFFPITYPVVNRVMYVWGHLANSNTPLEDLAGSVKQANLFDNATPPQKETVKLLINEDEPVSVVSYTKADKAKAVGLSTVFNLVGLGVGIGVLVVLDEARKRWDHEYDHQEPSLLTKLGLGYFAYFGYETGAYAAKLTYNRVSACCSSGFFARSNQPILQEEAPNLQKQKTMH